jgi:hypothetical protein
MVLVSSSHRRKHPGELALVLNALLSLTAIKKKGLLSEDHKVSQAVCKGNLSQEQSC